MEEIQTRLFNSILGWIFWPLYSTLLLVLFWAEISKIPISGVGDNYNPHLTSEPEAIEDSKF